MTCEHCQSKHNAMLMARDNAEAFKAERDRVRQEALTRIDALAADNERLRAEVLVEQQSLRDVAADGRRWHAHLTELREAADAVCKARDAAELAPKLFALEAVLAKLQP